MNEVERLQAELRAARDEQDRQFWLFTRCARGKPVDPAVTRRVVALEGQLAQAKREAKCPGW